MYSKFRFLFWCSFALIFHLSTRIVRIITPPSPKTFPCFHEGGGQLLGIFMNFHFFDSRPFQMSSSELKLYFITYYRPLVYFEVFSIYLSVFHEFMWSPKKSKKNFFGIFWIFWIFFFLVFARGGNYSDNSGIRRNYMKKVPF